MEPLNGLSNREMEVVQLLLEGKSNKQIALSLHITESTVEFHLKNIYEKCHVSSRTELILKLGKSTVAGEGENEENKPRSSSGNWVTSLREAVSSICQEFKMTSLSVSTARSDGNSMTFFESILVCLKKYAEFNGRASRSEFWWFTLSVILVASALVYMSEVIGGVFLIAALLPLLAAGSRRLHDSGHSGWWQLFLLAPVAGIVLVGIMLAMPPMSPHPDDTLSA
jgi:DNA-binding CsgD family transcriptional regulator